MDIRKIYFNDLPLTNTLEITEIDIDKNGELDVFDLVLIKNNS